MTSNNSKSWPPKYLDLTFEKWTDKLIERYLAQICQSNQSYEKSHMEDHLDEIKLRKLYVKSKALLYKNRLQQIVAPLLNL